MCSQCISIGPWHKHCKGPGMSDLSVPLPKGLQNSCAVSHPFPALQVPVTQGSLWSKHLGHGASARTTLLGVPEWLSEKASYHAQATWIMQYFAPLCWILETRPEAGSKECGGIYHAFTLPPYLWPVPVRFASSSFSGTSQQRSGRLCPLRIMQFRNKSWGGEVLFWTSCLHKWKKYLGMWRPRAASAMWSWNGGVLDTERRKRDKKDHNLGMLLEHAGMGLGKPKLT